jgi:hypothetical protein
MTGILRRFVLAAAVLGLAGAPVRGSSILFDSSPPDNQQAFLSDTAGGPQYLAGSFTLGSPATVGGVNFWGIFLAGGPTDTFTINLFSNSGGQPGSLLSTSSATLTGTANGGSTAGQQDFEFQSTFTGVPLSAGTYWLSVYDDNASSRFYWDTHTQTGIMYFNQTAPTGPWIQVDPTGTLAFQILSAADAADVPELDPGSTCAALSVLGIGVTMLRGRRGRAG